MSDLFEETSSSGDESAAAKLTSKATQNVGYTGYHPYALIPSQIRTSLFLQLDRDIVSAEPLSRTAGYILIVVSVSFLLLGCYATLFSAFWPSTGFKVRTLTSPSSLCLTTHRFWMLSRRIHITNISFSSLFLQLPTSSSPIGLDGNITGIHDSICCKDLRMAVSVTATTTV